MRAAMDLRGYGSQRQTAERLERAAQLRTT